MKAFAFSSYGPPENLQLTDFETPAPGAGEVLVRVRATSVNPYDWHYLRGEPVVARFMSGSGMGKRRPSDPILGCDLAGEVAAVGESVTRFRPGDRVFALVKYGSYAEYACVPEDHLVPIPAGLSFEQAAAVPMAGLTALIALRDNAGVRPGQTVLVNGASGGVGTFTVQLAKAFGAQVTAVCGPGNQRLVRSIGAADAIDYTATDFTKTARGFDALIDITGSPFAWAARRVLNPSGVYVAVGGRAGRWVRPVDHVISVMVMGKLTSTRTVGTYVDIGSVSAGNLTDLAAHLESGAVTPVIDRSYDFGDLPAAIRYVEQGHAAGKVVVTIP